ncbi:MAG: hypothetical protein ACJ75B_16905 [Flavisolibacter sp.]
MPRTFPALRKQNNFLLLVLFFSISFTGCLTPQKMDAYVAGRYNNQLPSPVRRKQEVLVRPAQEPTDKKISHTVTKTSHVLPLLVYWQMDYRHTCTLNPQLPVTNISNAINGMSGKILQKLNGRRLELTIEQVPTAFALVDKSYMILLFEWDHIFVEPDGKDLIVSYQVFQKDSVIKSGTVTVNNMEHNRNVRFAQSWRSSTREYLDRYESHLSSMGKIAAMKLLDEL